MKKFLMLVLALAIAHNAQSQTKQESYIGLPYVQVYEPEDYQRTALGTGQNITVMQDSRGFLYFGNANRGLLQYDGDRWRLIENSNSTAAQSLTEGSKNRIYIGAISEMGYLAPDSTARLQYVSLMPQIPIKYRDFDKVNYTIVDSLDEKVWFGTDKYIFKWADEKMLVYCTSVSFQGPFQWQNKIYIWEEHKGLVKLPDGLSMSENKSKTILPNTPVHYMIPYDESHALLATPEGKFYLFDGKSVMPFHTEVTSLLAGGFINGGIRLSDGRFAMATTKGLFVIDHNGKLLLKLDQTTGLPTNIINDVYAGREGNLWLALERGMARVELNSPLSFFDSRSGFDYKVEEITRHNGLLYVCTLGDRLFYLQQEKLHPVPGISKCYGSLLSTPKGLIVPHWAGDVTILQDLGLPGPPFNYNNINTSIVVGMLASSIDSNLVYLGLVNGVRAIRWNGRQWIRTGKYIETGITGYTLTEEPDGSLWIGSYRGGVAKITPLKTSKIQPVTDYKPKNIHIAYFDTSDGLPHETTNFVMQIDGHTVFQTEYGIYRFNKKKKYFYPDSSFLSLYEDGLTRSWPFLEDWQGRVWMDFGGQKVVSAVKGPDGNYQWKKSARKFRRLVEFGDILAIYPEGDSVAWFGTGDKLIRYDSSADNTSDAAFKTYVRGFFVKDSLRYGGISGASTDAYEIPYDRTSIQFTYAAPFYTGEAAYEVVYGGKRPAKTYQYYLEGFDEGWSNWSPRVSQKYINIPAGDYTFRVRARNIFGEISREGRFAFTIIPPWYQTWWAWILYGITFFGLVVSVVRWRTRTLERRVKDRTKKLIASKNQISRQAEELKELDQLKNQFYTNISHELRTPLTLMLGPLRNILNEDDRDLPEYIQQKLEPVLHSGRRLHRLVDQLLDLTKIEVGKMRISVALYDLTDFITITTSAFESLAENKGITLNLNIPNEPCLMYFDPEQLEKSLSNLLSNAIKFTPSGGHVDVSLQQTDDHAELKVEDSGIGISEKALDHIFDRFYQVDRTMTRREGMGVGLPLARKLVELHCGSLTVESTPGKGSVFTIVLHKGKDHFRDEQLADAPSGESGIQKMYKPEKIDLNMTKNGGNDLSETNQDQTTVLIIDDNADMCTYVRSVLEPEYHVLEAGNGAAGLEIILENLPDIILCDVMMPKMDGFALSRKLKEDPMTECIPVIFLTGRADKQAKLTGLSTGADDYITKPFDATVLQVRVKNLLQQRQRLRRRLLNEEPPQPKPKIRSPFEKRVREVINEYLPDSDFGVEDLAREVAVTRSHLTHKLKSELDMTSIELIRTMRLERAAELLEQQEGNISEVAYSVGFNSLSYFSKCFKAHFDTAPSTFIKQE